MFSPPSARSISASAALLLMACGSEPASLEVACAEGQTAIAGWNAPPESLRQEWAALDHEIYIAVLARRISDRELAPPTISPPATEGAHIAYCRETATHEVVDGLGWMAEETLELVTSSGQSFVSRSDGTPLPDSDLMHSDFFFDPEWQALAADDAVYLLILIQHPEQGLSLHRRVALVDADGTLQASGEYTASGEPIPIEEFRAP